jgi:hypothetical protein
VRLGTCIALELAMAAGTIGGVWLGVSHTIEIAGDYFSTHEAAAATVSDSERPAPTRLPAAFLKVEPPAAPPTVFGHPDDVLLAPIGAAKLVRVKPNKGGTSLSLRLDFENGARAAFKPEQINLQSEPRRELAAYRIDRLLGIGHVQPAKAIKFALADVIAAADPDYRTYTSRRITEEAVARGTELRGVASWWIPEIRDAKFDRLLVDSAEGMQVWASRLQAGLPIDPEEQPMLAQLATLVLFDVIIDNADRWSGWNTKASTDLRTLYFMDNTLSFSKFSHGHDNNLKPLYRIQVFPRALVGKIRAMTLEAVTATLAADDGAGLGPLLEPEEIRAIIARRDNVISYIDRLIAQHGEDAVLALP